MAERITRWREKNPTWDFRPWSAKDIDFDQCKYARMAYASKQWAYLSDYVRVQALYEEGGVYLDTDIELLTSLEQLRDDKLHIGYMHNCALGTAVIISPPKHPVIADLLDFYKQLDGDRMINNNAIFTEYFLQEVPDFKLDGRPWQGHGLSVHNKTCFEQPSFSRNGYSVHLYNRSWDNAQARHTNSGCSAPGFLFAVKRMIRSVIEEARCHYLPYYIRGRYRLPIPLPKLELTFCSVR